MPEPTGGIATLGINLNIFIAQLVNFLVVLLVLWKFAYGPIVKLLDDRTKKIETGLKQAEEIERRVKQLETEKQEVISAAKMEAKAILEMAQQEAETRKQDMLGAAKKEVERVVLQGKEQLKAEKAQMMQEAKSELVEMVVLAAKKVLETSVDEKTSQKLANEAIDSLAKGV